MADDALESIHFKVAWARRSTDGGSLLLVIGGNGETALLEARQASQGAAPMLALAHALVGVRVEWDEGSAYLVTSRDHSKAVQLGVDGFRRDGFAYDLASVWEALSALGLYNPDIPSLDQLTSSICGEIVSRNQRTLR